MIAAALALLATASPLAAGHAHPAPAGVSVRPETAGGRAGGEQRATLREGAARYRVELAGAHVGVAELAFTCPDAARCRLAWSSTLRLPAASGGQLVEKRVAAVMDREGRVAGEVALDLDGARRVVPMAPGGAEAVPASAAELLLAARGGGCLAIVDEESGAAGTACGAIEGRTLRATVLGVAEVVTLADDGFPARVEVPAQRTCYVRDAGARAPDAAPPLEVRVPGPEDATRARRFCGRAPDGPAPAVDLARLPPPRPDGRSCRDQAAAYVSQAREAGLEARVALGVAHDGRGFVWHAWAEVRTSAGWVAVDPAFGELPARGPRFTVARHARDAAGRDAAGRGILACWGTAAVE